MCPIRPTRPICPIPFASFAQLASSPGSFIGKCGHYRKILSQSLAVQHFPRVSDIQFAQRLSKTSAVPDAIQIGFWPARQRRGVRCLAPLPAPPTHAFVQSDPLFISNFGFLNMFESRISAPAVLEPCGNTPPPPINSDFEEKRTFQMLKRRLSLNSSKHLGVPRTTVKDSKDLAVFAIQIGVPTGQGPRRGNARRLRHPNRLAHPRAFPPAISGTRNTARPEPAEGQHATGLNCQRTPRRRPRFAKRTSLVGRLTSGGLGKPK